MTGSSDCTAARMAAGDSGRMAVMAAPRARPLAPLYTPPGSLGRPHPTEKPRRNFQRLTYRSAVRPELDGGRLRELPVHRGADVHGRGLLVHPQKVSGVVA